jgi:DNA-binding NtrC family response regulator
LRKSRKAGGAKLSRQVLLVDDDSSIVDFMERFLKRHNIASIKAVSGQQALEAYNKDTVGLVFLDMGLEDMHGVEVLEELKKINPDVKVIVFSGKFEKDLHVKTKDLGIVDFIAKPVDLTELKEKVNRYIVK